MQPLAGRGIRALACRPGGRVRRAPHHARLCMEHGGRGRMGHGVPHPHRRGHAAGGRGASRHVLARIRHRHAAHDPGELRRAHLSGIRRDRGAFVLGLPDKPPDHLRVHGVGGRGVLHGPLLFFIFLNYLILMSFIIAFHILYNQSL